RDHGDDRHDMTHQCAYLQVDAIFCTNSTMSVGGADVSVPGLISPEISTFVFTNGENWLSIPARRYVSLDVLAVAGERPVSGGTRSTRAAVASTNRASSGVLASCTSRVTVSFGAGCKQPLSVMRSARFGGSGCSVPGVGLPPTISLPPTCASTISVE